MYNIIYNKIKSITTDTFEQHYALVEINDTAQVSIGVFGTLKSLILSTLSGHVTTLIRLILIFESPSMY